VISVETTWTGEMQNPLPEPVDLSVRSIGRDTATTAHDPKSQSSVHRSRATLERTQAHQ
jgi:hypothetical protein